jgi:hypothetical protein
MGFHWLGSPTRDPSYLFGSLAVVAPILQRMDLAGIIDRHLPADPQAEFAYGPLLSLLVAARLANPVALVNVGNPVPGDLRVQHGRCQGLPDHP